MRAGIPDIAAHPHDGIVRYAFSKRVHAIGLLKAILPPSVTSAAAWSTLKVDKDSFVDPSLRKRYADLLFSFRVRRTQVHAYVLFEHQRATDPLMMARLLVYMGRIWDRLLRDDPRRTTIPTILPVVLYNGTSAWSAPTSFEHLVDLPEALRKDLLPRTPRFTADLVDLAPSRATAIADKWLTAFGKLVLWALSVADDDDRFIDEIGRMKDTVHEILGAADGYEVLGAILRYISSTHERIGTERFRYALTSATAEKDRNKVMTLLEKFWQEGAIKGRAEGQAQMLLDQLAARFGPVPADVRARVSAANEATLRRWSIRVLTAATMAGVLDGRAAGGAKKKSARAARPTRVTGAARA